ncbi:hypothetical protein [Noviherbaspirillum malthae]|uniref:hypothetical protein n=1 Tax=Noviherbaspirillum malthae TaxID=1260987 RepID=UPI00188DF982|nr:hypothetical protein [Noviherbaspirillum malthae]
MRRATLMTSIVLTLVGFHGTGAAEAKSGSLQARDVARERKASLLIRVAPGDWGNANPAEIEALLNSVGNEMLKHFPGSQVPPIIVSPSRNGPLVMYQKGPSNEYQVLLAAKDTHWAEYVYEFSHELLHILAGYDLRAPTRTARHQWFEEMLCETASLYMLKRYALSWDVLAPRTEWKGYTAELQRFTNRAFSEKHRRLPVNVTFEDWYQENGQSLATKPYLREKNELVAMMFLPLLEQIQDWRAIGYLNLDNREGDPTLQDYLARWYRKTPVAQRQLVKNTFGVFHFNLPAEDAGPAAAGMQAAVQAEVSMPDEGAAGKRGR